jgi:probable rRNA maturation factor
VTRSIYVGPWRVDTDVRHGIPRVLATAKVARVAAAALDAVSAPAPASLGVILSDDRELAALNAEHMGKRGPTDVLSFPLLPPAVFAPGAGAPDVPRPPRSRIHLGDVVVSVERAIDQAEAGRGGQTGDVRWSPADELRLLVTHGVLHVCGWDHATATEEAAMRALERRLLSGSDSR